MRPTPDKDCLMKSLLAVALLAATPAFAAPEPVITGTRLDISATGSVDRAPDMATIGAGVVTQSSSAGAALSDNAKRMTATIAALKRAGVADRDIQTASLSLQPQYRYGDNPPPVLTGYQASNRVSVRLRDLERAGAVIDALVASGANQLDGPTFGIDKPEAALDEARTQALATAKARADLYAKAAGLHIKRIVQISESEVGGPVVRPMAMMAMAKRDSTPVAAGEQTLSVNLSVTFELE
jgi:uncharacterized protein YggE